MNVEKIINDLMGKKTVEHYKRLAEYIAWQLANMSNQELAETTAEEITKGIFSLDKIYGAIEAEARKLKPKGSNVACLVSERVFEIVREELKIKAAVPDNECRASDFFAWLMKKEDSVPIGISSEPVSAAVSIDFDEIWG